MNELLAFAAAVILFVLVLWWLSWHPAWGLSQLPASRRDPPRIYGYDDPGEIETEVELRFAAYEPPPERPGGTGYYSA